MIYKKYQTNHEEEKIETDGCNGCKYIFVQTWEEPCRRCKRTAKDLYERASNDVRQTIEVSIESLKTDMETEKNRKILDDIKSGKGLPPIKMEGR